MIYLDANVVIRLVEGDIATRTPLAVRLAATFRAKYNLKTPDAIHYAAAVEAGASVFLTGDRGLARCSEVPVELL